MKYSFLWNCNNIRAGKEDKNTSHTLLIMLIFRTLSLMPWLSLMPHQIFRSEYTDLHLFSVTTCQSIKYPFPITNYPAYVIYSIQNNIGFVD